MGRQASKEDAMRPHDTRRVLEDVAQRWKDLPDVFNGSGCGSSRSSIPCVSKNSSAFLRPSPQNEGVFLKSVSSTLFYGNIPERGISSERPYMVSADFVLTTTSVFTPSSVLKVIKPV